jgi:hypothetical protein
MTQTQETPHTQDATPQAWHNAVRAVADQATRTLPQCASRIARAVALVLAGAVELLPDGTACVASQRDGQTTYRVVNGHCDCADFAQAPQGLCKHRLAQRLARHAQSRLAQAPADPAGTPAAPDTRSQPPAPPRRGTSTAQALIAAAVTQAEQACRVALAQTDPAYQSFLTWLSQKKKVAEVQGKPVYAEIQLPYMAVDGRICMAIDEHRAQGQSLAIQTEFCPEPTSGHLLCRATVRSPLRGTVTAHARVFLGGSGVNTTNPLENGETSAIGRALGFLGYGLYGTGIASADEVLQAQAARATAGPPDETPGADAPASDVPPPAGTRRTGQERPPSERQRALIRTLLQEQGVAEDAITTRLAAVTTSHEASRLIDDLRAQTA